MTQSATTRWEKKRTAETRRVEKALSDEGFENVAAYRYNSASIRVRVIDPRFEGRSSEKRAAFVEPVLKKLDPKTQADIISLFTFAPSEVEAGSESTRAYLQNLEFEDPSPSIL